MTTVSFENFSADQVFLRYDSPQWAEKCAQNWITFILKYKSFLWEHSICNVRPNSAMKHYSVQVWEEIIMVQIYKIFIISIVLC